MKLSTLSIIPPCSGNKSPKSFIPESLFSMDAVRSPTNPRNATIIPCIGPVKNQNGQRITQAPMVAKDMAKRVPPKYPSTVLFGLAAPAAGAILPSFVFPNLRPAKYAPTSENAILIHVQKMKIAPFVIGKWMHLGKKAGRLFAFVPNASNIGARIGAKRVGSLPLPIIRIRTQKEGMYPR